MTDRGYALVIPPVWREVVAWLVTRLEGNGPVAWVGEAGLYVPPEALVGGTAEAVAGWLQRYRFPGMNPTFLPFAQDGAGNRFCFAYEPGRLEPFIVLWMYETFAALPVSGTFRGFLDWIGMTAAFAARQRLHPVIDDVHLHEEVLPTLEAWGRTLVYPAFFEESVVDLCTLHRALVEVDPGAAGSHLMLAQRAAEQGAVPDAMERCDRALALTSRLTLAASLRADCVRAESRWRAQDDLMQAFRGYHGFGGDPLMVGYGTLPVGDVSRLAELLSSGPEASERALSDPVWELILYENPLDPEAWLRVALDHVEREELVDAVDMAVNALYFGLQEPIAPRIVEMLSELYEALDAPFFAELAGGEAARLERRGEDARRGT